MDAETLRQALIARGYSPEQADRLSLGVTDDQMYTIQGLESGHRPDVQTGSYKGLNQISNSEFRRYGGQGSIFDPAENTRVAKAKLDDEVGQVERRLGRPLTPEETYMVHQQGVGGAFEHISQPDRPAWQSMYATAEGQQKGPGWARQAIWGNLPDAAKKQFGNVDAVTSGDFLNWWKGRYDREAGSSGNNPASMGNDNVLSQPNQAGPAAAAAAPVYMRTANRLFGNDIPEGFLPRAGEGVPGFGGGSVFQPTPTGDSGGAGGGLSGFGALAGAIGKLGGGDQPMPALQPLNLPQPMTTPQMLQARMLAQAMLARDLNGEKNT